MNKEKSDINTFLKQQRKKLKDIENPIKSFDGLNSYPLNAFQCLYVHNFQSSTITYQKGVFEFLGYTPEEFNSQLAHSYFHPDDKETVLRIIQAAVGYAVDHGLCKNGHLYLTYRLRKKNGEYIKVLRQSNIFEVDKNGRLISNMSLLTDISYMNTSNCVEWKFDAKGIDQEAFKKYVGHQYENYFSPRELEIISGINRGLNSEEIGNLHFISKHTVDTHRRNILKKAGCKNSIELISFCRQNGVI
ncbi:MAG: PAS domain-containing protein [Brumimicrobium sp.]